MSQTLTITPRALAPGRTTELLRTLSAEWTQRSTDPRKHDVDCTRVAASQAREQVLATDGTAISRLAVTWASWRDAMTYNASATVDDALSGKAYVVAVVNRRLQVAGPASAPVSADERRLLEVEYASLGQPEAVERAPRVFPPGQPADAAAVLVLALLLRHARGPGGYSPSVLAHVEAKLTRLATGPTGDAGTFAVRLEPVADPSLAEHLRLAGELQLGAHGWPLALTLEGTFDRRVVSRTDTTTSDGRLRLALSWGYP
jgi:hypothetical protein